MRDLAQRTRINGFFYAALVPKLKTCWGKISGKGEIEFKLTYRKAGQNWEWQQAELESKAPQAQAATALACMQDSARGSSFPTTPDEARSEQFGIHWAWPVPFPDDTSELARMIDTGGGGEGPAKKCFDCQSNPPGSPRTAQCVSTSTGYSTCRNDPDGKGCSMCCLDPKCASGWSGGAWGGGIFIASAKQPRGPRHL